MKARFPMLTSAEIERFASWLEQEADTDMALAAQVLKLPSGPIMDPMATKLYTEASAEKIVAEKLRGYQKG